MAQRHLYLQWDSTNDCNLDCIHCYHPKHIQDESLMSLEDSKNMLDDLSNTAKRWSMVPRISISGGEPLMRGDLLEILYYAKERSVITAILTNGILITSKKAKEIYGVGVRRIQVSLDGKKETHNRIRNASFAYDGALEGIVNASEAGIDVTVSMTLMQTNLSDFEDVVKTAIKTGAKKVGFHTYVPDRKLGLRDPEYVGAADAFPVFRRTGELMEQYGKKIIILNSDVLWQIIEPTNQKIQEAKKQNKYLAGCSAGYMSLSVLSDGTVYPCRRLPIPIGNIKEGIGNLIIGNGVMQELRDLDRMRKNTLCDKVVHCRGCRAVAYAVTGDYMAKDPMCFKHLLGEKK
jgi:radical SAM protein with 4Fe4S-binding SPASM domain